MRRSRFILAAAASTVLAGSALAGQAPYAASAPDFPVSHRDRVYAAEQYSNTVCSVSSGWESRYLRT